jgi:hypothetical protein
MEVKCWLCVRVLVIMELRQCVVVLCRACNSNEYFICGFSSSLDKCTIIFAELSTIIRRMEMLKDKSFTSLEIEFDYFTIVSLILNEYNLHPCAMLYSLSDQE